MNGARRDPRIRRAERCAGTTPARIRTSGPHALSRSEREAVRRIAALARLEIRADEEQQLGADFASILAAFHSLAELDLSAARTSDPGGEDPVPADPGAAEPATRADEPRPSLPAETVLANAPDPEDGFYGVPKTIGGDA